jgi:hypothetical protein
MGRARVGFLLGLCSWPLRRRFVGGTLPPRDLHEPANCFTVGTIDLSSQAVRTKWLTFTSAATAVHVQMHVRPYTAIDL